MDRFGDLEFNKDPDDAHGPIAVLAHQARSFRLRWSGEGLGSVRIIWCGDSGARRLKRTEEKRGEWFLDFV
jgi:hypothetical protein